MLLELKPVFRKIWMEEPSTSHLVSTVPQDRISSVYTRENPVISLFKQLVIQEQCEDCSSVAVGTRGLLVSYCPACGHPLCLLTMVGLKTFLGDYPPTPFHVKEAYFSLCHKMLLVAFSCRTAGFPLPVGRSQQGSGPWKLVTHPSSGNLMPNLAESCHLWTLFQWLPRERRVLHSPV